jgi:hypothetical protein
MKRELRNHPSSAIAICLLFLPMIGLALSTGCQSGVKKPTQPPSLPSNIRVLFNSGGPVILQTGTAEFQVQPSGYIQASLIEGGEPVTLDEPEQGKPFDSNYLLISGKEVHFLLDFGAAKNLEAIGKLGPGRRIEIPARPLGPSGGGTLQATLVLEIYDDFPNIALTSVEYKNGGVAVITLDQAVAQRHRFNSHVAKAAPYDMWSFQGSSYEWGKDDILKLRPALFQPNEMGAIVNGGFGGGIPVAAFWTGSVGEAIGHIETLPLTVSLPVKVNPDSRVSASMVIPANVTLQPGETFFTPRTFIAVFAGDYYEP